MSDVVLTEELWALAEPLLPVRPRRFRYPGRLPADDRAALQDILWVLRNDVPWRELPMSLFGVSGVTCWRRLRDWQTAGAWQQLHEVLLAECNAAGLLDLHAALVDSSHIHTLKRGATTGPSPVNRTHPGSKHHLITDKTGVPLAAILTGGNRHDVTQLLPLVEAIPPIRGRRGRPRRRPRYLLADRAYDHDTYRRQLTARGSPRSSPGAAHATASGWAGTAGRSNGPSPGGTSSAGSVPAGNAPPTSTTPSSPWPARSSACENSADHSETGSKTAEEACTGWWRAPVLLSR